MSRLILRFALGGFALLGLPLLGIHLAGLPTEPYLAFPPGDLHIHHAGFSWPVFGGLAIIELICVGLALRAARRGSGIRPSTSPRTFPWWGWLGLVWTASWWVIAWNRFPFFAPLQGHTFTPLWLGYIVVINAVSFQSAGRCLLTHNTGYLLKLFPLSAGFWWFFEYLNRFVQNWMYHGVSAWSPLEYFLLATFSFSTVLPAVMSTTEWLELSGVAHRADDRPAKAPSSTVRWLMFIGSIACLLFLGWRPNLLFPFLWLAPLGCLILIYPSDHFHIVFPSVGTVLRLSLAALICGFFWELWNLNSQAKWVYHVPFVQRFHIFEMPMLGYFGYLPFGWECAWLAAMVRRT
jgi:hypothetical protein